MKAKRLELLSSAENGETYSVKELSIVIPITLILSGCGTLFGAKSDDISIHSNQPGTRISVNGNEIGRDQATYAVPRGQTAIITVSKPGCDERSVPTQQSFAAVSVLDILFWPGFIVDTATGAIHKTDPTEYTVTPACR